MKLMESSAAVCHTIVNQSPPHVVQLRLIAIPSSSSPTTETSIYNYIVIQTLTSHSSTPTPRVACDIGVPWAFNKMTFTATALNTTQTEWANANTKLSTAEGHCICWHKRVKVTYVCKLNYQTCTWPWLEYPSCWHATEASVRPQESSHTVPHRLSTHISTLPSFAMLLPARRSWPVAQGAV